MKHKRLLIVGNGFDFARKIPCRYIDFKSYLETNYDAYGDYYLPVNVTMMPDG